VSSKGFNVLSLSYRTPSFLMPIDFSMFKGAISKSPPTESSHCFSASSPHSLHREANRHAKQKPQKRIKRANLPQHVARHTAVVPNAHMKHAVYHHANGKLRRGYRRGTNEGAQKNIPLFHFLVHSAYSYKAGSASKHHRKMSSASPNNLQKSIPYTAEHKFQKALLPFFQCSVKNARGKKAAFFLFSVFDKVPALCPRYIHSSAPASAIIARKEERAAESPPSSSIRPHFTARSPSTIVPTSFVIS